MLSVTRPQGLLANYVSRKQLTFRIGLLSSKEKEKLKKLSVLFNRVAGQARQRKCTNSCVRNVSALATPVATFSWAISAFVRASILHEQGPVRVRRAPVHSSVDTHQLILLGANLCNQKAESVHDQRTSKRAQYDRISSVEENNSDLLGGSGGVVNSLDFCPASLKSVGCFYFRCVLSLQ